MPRINPARRAGPVGTAFMLWGLWRRLPRRQRRWVIAQARQHAPRLARQVYASRRRR